MSQILEYVKIALMNIKGNKGRSILTMLGIIIGIASVIMIISIGNGMKSQVSGELNDMAGGQIMIAADNANDAGEYIEFTEDDFAAIKEKVDHVKGVTPNYNMWGCTAVGRKGNFTANVTGGTESLEFSTKEKIIKGQYFTAEDYYAAKKVCVMNESSAKTLFGTSDVVGMTIELDMYGISQDLTIVGIREDSQSSMMTMMNGGGNAVQIDIPLSLFSSYGYYLGGFTDFIVIGDSAEHTTEMANACIKLMEARHNIRGEGRLQLQNFADMMDQVDSVLGTVTLFVVFVAAISLLVGGIGVMNIMLVSVTERTREIGIRKALGARTASIMMQFLSESAIITLVGGIIGIIIGVLGAVAISSLVGMKAEISFLTVLMATVFSSGVGIFFGIYPAKKAAKLSPIEALRHE